MPWHKVNFYFWKCYMPIWIFTGNGFYCENLLHISLFQLHCVQAILYHQSHSAHSALLEQTWHKQCTKYIITYRYHMRPKWALLVGYTSHANNYSPLSYPPKSATNHFSSMFVTILAFTSNSRGPSTSLARMAGLLDDTWLCWTALLDPLATTHSIIVFNTGQAD